MARTRRSNPRPHALVLDTETAPDRISRLLNAKNLVPQRFRGTDEYLDVVAWNIRKFEAQDPGRVDAVSEVLAALNADVFVLTEIASLEALDPIADALKSKRAGYYSAAVGESRSEQRVALLWDRDWIRAKSLPVEILGDQNDEVTEEGLERPQRTFPRLPLWGYFEALAADSANEGFTFELAGVHLKAQGPAPRNATVSKPRWGIPQRTSAAKKLAEWLMDGPQHYDSDLIVVGDWNAKPSAPEWASIRKLERDGEVAFSRVNRDDEVSHLARLNKSGPAGTRLDLVLVTSEAEANAVPDNVGAVVQWSAFDELPALSTEERSALARSIREVFSDHLPVVSRFYLTDVAGD